MLILRVSIVGVLRRVSLYTAKEASAKTQSAPKARKDFLPCDWAASNGADDAAAVCAEEVAPPATVGCVDGAEALVATSASTSSWTVLRPLSRSRFRRCKSDRISEAC